MAKKKTKGTGLADLFTLPRDYDSMANQSKLRIGFVGTGLMGQSAHLRNYASLEDCEVVAIAESRDEIREKVAARFGVPSTYRDAASMLKAEKLDGIVASQQFSRHGIIVRELLPAGIPLFIEKPLAASLETAVELERADRAAGGKIMLGYHKRSDPATIWAKAEIEKLLASGEIGPLRYVRVTMPPGHWVANGTYDAILESQSAAPKDRDPVDPGLSDEDSKAFLNFVNFYIHQVNLVRHLLGEPYDFSYVDPSGVVIVGHGRKSRTPIVIEMAPYSTGADWQETAMVAFAAGYVKLTYPAPLAINRAGTVELHKDPKPSAGSPVPAQYPIRMKNAYVRTSDWGSGTTVIPKLPNDHAMRVQAVNFLRFIRGEAPPTCGTAEALDDLRLAREWLKLSRGV